MRALKFFEVGAIGLSTRIVDLSIISKVWSGW